MHTYIYDGAEQLDQESGLLDSGVRSRARYSMAHPALQCGGTETFFCSCSPPETDAPGDRIKKRHTSHSTSRFTGPSASVTVLPEGARCHAGSCNQVNLGGRLNMPVNWPCSPETPMAAVVFPVDVSPLTHGKSLSRFQRRPVPHLNAAVCSVLG
jgi:hypothetical protein